jgi:hypothetical protein
MFQSYAALKITKCHSYHWSTRFKILRTQIVWKYFSCSYLHMHVGVQVCGWWVAGVGAVVPGVVVVVVGHYLVAEGEVMRRRRRWLGAHQNTARSRIHLPRSGRSNKIACPSDSVFVFVWVSAALSTTETSRPLRASTASEPFRCSPRRSQVPGRLPIRPPPPPPPRLPPRSTHATALAEPPAAALHLHHRRKAKAPHSDLPTALENQIIRAAGLRPAGASQQWIVFAWCSGDYTLLESRHGSFAIICESICYVATHYSCFVLAEITNTCFANYKLYLRGK